MIIPPYLYGTSKNLTFLFGAGSRSFDEFWSQYPKIRRYKKAKCLEIWNKLDCHDQVIKGLAWWKRHRQWTAEDGKYVPAPDVWLRNQMWLDAEGLPPVDPNVWTPRETTHEDIQQALSHLQ